MTAFPLRISAAAAVALALGLGACSSDSTTTTAASTSTTASSAVGSSSTTMGSSGSTPGTEAMASDDIVDTAVAAGDFTTLVAAVQAAGLEETLRGDGPFTVFAPTDAAFAALPAGTLDSLLADPAALSAILTYHVVPGKVLAADVAGMDGTAVTTVNGATFTVNVGTDGTVTLTDGTGKTVEVVTTDVEASNGVIHVIDAVLLPA